MDWFPCNGNEGWYPCETGRQGVAGTEPCITGKQLDADINTERPVIGQHELLIQGVYK
jgi:hypothetical protein